MTRDEYETALARNKSLMHGSAWKDHKYIRIENGRYIYDDKKGPTGSTAEQKAAENAARNAGRDAVKNYDKKADEDWIAVEKERIRYKNSRKESDEKFRESIKNLPDEAKKRAIAEREKQVKEADDKKEESLKKETFRREQKREFIDPISKNWGNIFANAVKDKDEKRIEEAIDAYLKLCADCRNDYLDRGFTESEADAEVTELLLLTEYEYQSKLGNFGSGTSNVSDDFGLKKTIIDKMKSGRAKNVTGTGKGVFKREKVNTYGPVGQVKHSFSSKEEFYAAVEQSKEELAHFGTKGMRWGFRRYQNEDGTLTPEGRARYDKKIESDAKSGLEKMIDRKIPKKASNKKIAYREGVKTVGSTLLSAAVVATAVKNGKNIYKNINDKKYFKAAFDATKLAGKVFVGAQLVANAIGHAKRAGMAIGVEQMKNDRAASEARKSAYMYGEANAKAKASGSKADAQWTKTQESYRTLGSGPISRAVAARKNESPAAKEYNANRSKAVNLSTQAKLDQARADELRRKSGRTKLERDYNMAKYGR